MKICTKCRTEKNESEFTVQRNRPDGLSIYCRACWRQYREDTNNREYQRKWREEHPSRSKSITKEQRRRYNETRKSRMFNIPMLAERQTDGNGVLRCAYCGKPLFPGNFHVDHVTPLSRGGSSAADNLCLACPDCNRRKGRMTLEEWNKTKKY